MDAMLVLRTRSEGYLSHGMRLVEEQLLACVPAIFSYELHCGARHDRRKSNGDAPAESSTKEQLRLRSLFSLAHDK